METAPSPRNVIQNVRRHRQVNACFLASWLSRWPLGRGREGCRPRPERGTNGPTARHATEASP
eukprot:3504553-Alexandrium_andersonii.AAC.1